MARPVKEGMDYFSHDTDAVNDEKIEALRMLYGNDGYAFYFILLERIYRSNNFELDISDAETVQILTKKVAVTEDKFNQMLQTALKRECFDREAYEQRGVLTSAGIKKRAAQVVEKRAAMRDKYHKSKSKVSDAETDQESPPETPPSKEKESKEKQITTSATTESFSAAHERIYGFPGSHHQIEVMYSYVDDGMDELVVIRAMERAAEISPSHNFRLIKKILNDYLGVKAFTLDQAIAFDTEFEKRNKGNPPRRKPPNQSLSKTKQDILDKFKKAGLK